VPRCKAERSQRLPAASTRISLLQTWAEPGVGPQRVERSETGCRKRRDRCIRCPPVYRPNPQARRPARESRHLFDEHGRHARARTNGLRACARVAGLQGLRTDTMASQSALFVRGGIYRTSGRDGFLVALAAAHALVLLAVPVMPVIALGVWWNSNTISHNFIHRPFF